jgi:succinate dehydrogenase / fumarate reductase flavoprotein subunit
VQSGKTQAGEAKRHDESFSHVAAWEFKGAGNAPVLHKEALVYETVQASIRSYA